MVQVVVSNIDEGMLVVFFNHFFLLGTPLPPTVTITPGVLSVTEGSDAIFTCNSSQPAEFLWSFNAVNPLPGNAEVQNLTSTISQLRIEGAAVSNAGAYYCKATFAGGLSAAAYTDLILIGNQSCTYSIIS